MAIPVTVPVPAVLLLITAVALTGVVLPPPPLKATVGRLVYTCVLLAPPVDESPVTIRRTTAVPCAPVPPPPVNVTLKLAV
jgi:hypothetical protein